MRDLYRADNPEPKKVKFKKGMTPQEAQEAVKFLRASSRLYIKKATDIFLEKFRVEDRFNVTVKKGIINTMPPEYNEAFINRITRLAKMAESERYAVKFSEWKQSKEYNWFFVREDETA